MKYASGKASNASVIVTAAAMPIVRAAMRRYVPFEWSRSWKFCSVQLWTSLPVNASTLQKEETKSETSAAR